MHEILELVKSRSIEGPQEEFSVKKITFLQISYFGKKWGRVQVIWNRLVELWLLECIFGDLWHWVVSTWWEAPEVEEHTRAPPERGTIDFSGGGAHLPVNTRSEQHLSHQDWWQQNRNGNASAQELQFMKTAGSTKESVPALELFKLLWPHSIQKSLSILKHKIIGVSPTCPATQKQSSIRA